MLRCPTLARVPSVHQSHLSLKVTQTGVTFLTKYRYRTRYTGSKNCAVDINGNLYLNASELKAAEGKDKKNAAAVRANRMSSNDAAVQSSANFSTIQNN